MRVALRSPGSLLNLNLLKLQLTSNEQKMSLHKLKIKAQLDRALLFYVAMGKVLAIYKFFFLLLLEVASVALRNAHKENKLFTQNLFCLIL